MPHISIKHFPLALTEDARAALRDQITGLICRHLGAEAHTVSIAMEAVEPGAWGDSVYTPEIMGRQRPYLIKKPGYRPRG